MSSICNNGSISFSDVNLNKVISIMNESRFRNVIGEVTDHDFYLCGNDADYNISDVYGDITDELDDLVERLNKAGISPEISITVFDSYGDGRIVLSDDGTHVEYLDQTDCGLRDASTEELISELMRRNGSTIQGDFNEKHMKRGFLVPTPLGILHAYPAYDPDYPGVLIDITPKDQNGEIGLATIEVTETEHDLEEDAPHLVGRSWADPDTEEWTDRVVYKLPVKEDK